MRRVVDEFGDRVLIGEIYLPVDRLVAYYGRELSGAHLPFNFALLSTPWNARAIAKLIDDYESALPAAAWPNWVLGNHDRPRVASRVGQAQARVAAMLLLTLRGTPTLYYGDEIGHTTGRRCARSGTRSVREKRPGDRRRTRRLPHAHAM
jgi:alpha-glucosidase